MNLKLVVASMSLLGLASCPVYAGSQDASHQKPHKIKHHRTAHHDYKDYKAVDMPLAAPVEVCSISQESLVLQSMTQNVGRAVPNPCSPDWYKRIMIAGGINVDFGKWGDRGANYMGENYRRFSLNDAYLNIGASVNDWVRAFASISYNTATINNPYDSAPFFHVAEFNAAYSENVKSGSQYALQLEQAFATFGNFEVSPFFIQIGKQYQDFGRYTIHPITESLTQVMSKTLATSAKFGFVANGFNGSVYVFDDPLSKISGTSQPTNYGAALGFDYPCENFGFSVGVGYLYNLIGVNDIAYQVNQFNINNSSLGLGFGQSGYHHREAGLAAYLDLNTGPFLASLRYTTALSHFNVNDLPEDGIAGVDFLTGIPLADEEGARPWSAGLILGMNFDNFWGWGCGGDNKIYAGYEVSREAAGLLIPKNRWLVGASIEPWNQTVLAIEWDNDHNYSTANGGNGSTTNLVSLRAGVRFS